MFSDAELSLLILIINLDELDIPVLLSISDREHNNSAIACKQLTWNIVDQIIYLEFDISAFNKNRYEILKNRFDDHKVLLGNLRKKMSRDKVRANDMAQKNLSRVG